jgi:transposase-like protein/IS1 family transposase
MDPATVVCPKRECPARGPTGAGTMGLHARTHRRCICTQCCKTCTATHGTVFYRRRTAADLVVLIVTLRAQGGPVQALGAACGVDERTVAAWGARAGRQGRAVHTHLVEQPRDLEQVQADEIRVKRQGGIVWMALAMMVKTRLWLAGEVSEQRDMTLIRRLIERVRTCALHRPLLFCTDGLCSYIRAIRETFREPVQTGGPGRPRLRPWRNLCIAQVVKRYAQRRVIDVERRIVAGTPVRVETLRRRSQGDGVINTAYIERLNATFRERLAPLARRCRALARHTLTLEHGMYLVGTIYNFCTEHASLRLAASAAGTAPFQRTPAMAAGITEHCWTVQELLSFHVPPSRWIPPKRRGRPSQALQCLVERWCS